MNPLSPPSLVAIAVLILGVAQVGLCRFDCPFNQDEDAVGIIQFRGIDCPHGDRCIGLASHVGEDCPNDGCAGTIEKAVGYAACDADIFCHKHDKVAKRCIQQVKYTIVRCSNAGPEGRCRLQANFGTKAQCDNHEQQVECHGTHIRPSADIESTSTYYG